ncbi:15-hydroxyprostaglandin dehydrogenase (NAD(+)) [Fonsecaea pedrosoi]|nr:15-hydroxyprostaglandin dehydrogenase (NAD(+)) [Fonsecaea pedrosoi]
MATNSPVAIITGGASGIGLATVERLVELGWNVSIIDFNGAGADIAKCLGEQTFFHQANVASYEAQADVFSQTYKRWGRIDFVFANAGILDREDFCAPSEASGDDGPPRPDVLVIDVDLYGVVWSTYLALHYFRKNASKAGKLAMTSSSAGIYACSEIPLYAAAKHGIIGLARGLGKRMKEQGEPITVNAILPGMVATGILSGEIVQSVPLQYKTPASLIVDAVEMILKDDSLTGQAIECSGAEIVLRPALPFVNKASEYTAGGKYREGGNADAVLQFGQQRGRQFDM